MSLNRTLVVGFSLALVLVGCGGSITGGGLDAAAGSGASTGTGGGSAGSGGSTGSGGTTGTGGATTTIPCSAMNGCACLAAAGRCVPRAEACWCPTECYPGAPIDCVCGGGRFIQCEDQAVVAGCNEALAAVQTLCAGNSLVQYIGTLCSAAPYTNTACVTGCLDDLSRTGSCAEIDCSFCPVCDCASTSPSPFTRCLQACLPTR